MLKILEEDFSGNEEIRAELIYNTPKYGNDNDQADDHAVWVFEQFYSKNSIQTMFRFLDEESTLLEEVKIMWSLFSWSFIKAFFKTL